MIISLILDPSVMNGESFQTISGYRENVHTLFKGLAANGVLLDDSHGTLQRELRQSIESLPPKYRQRLQGCFEELVKNKKQRIIKMPAQATRGGVRGTMTRLNELHPVDALCVSEETLQSLGEPPPNALPVVEYAYSEVESLRERYLAEMPSLHELSMREVVDLWARAVRYCKWLRFYDTQSGKGKNLKRFFQGIDFILGIWERYGVVPKEKPEVQIITSTAHYIREDSSDYVAQQYIKENKQAAEDIHRLLIRPLQKRYKHWEIGLRIKNVQPDLFHARYLHGQFLILNVERGFDFIRGSEYRECLWCERRISCSDCSVDVGCAACLISLRKTDDAHLARLWQLPDYPLP